ncbi:MAG TPA: heme exporter protein CcmD [Rhizomicrobium sp.]|nr:heme exporter protein CcmD [Rhizomicrobium sp.]
MNFDVSPYGAYIWPAYGLSVLVLGGMITWTVAKWRAAKAKLAALEAGK